MTPDPLNLSAAELARNVAMQRMAKSGPGLDLLETLPALTAQTESCPSPSCRRKDPQEA